MGGPVVIKHAPKALTVDDLSLGHGVGPYI